jgi:hypothetical protein
MDDSVTDTEFQIQWGNVRAARKYFTLSHALISSHLTGKFGLKHSGPEIEAMAAIAAAAKIRSLEQFQLAVRTCALYCTAICVGSAIVFRVLPPSHTSSRDSCQGQ